MALSNSQTSRLLWAGLLGGPFMFLLNLQLNYMLVSIACQSGKNTMLHVVALGCLILTFAAAAVAWKLWHTSGADWPADTPGATSRTRFMSFWGVLTNCLFLFAGIALWLPAFILNPCQR